jgi:hypothetical protein
MTGPSGAPATECVYVYGIVDRDLHLSGADAALPVTPVGRVGVVHAMARRDQFEGLGEDLSEGGRLAVLARHHDRTLQAIAAAGTVLPVRLGVLFPDTETMSSLIAATEDSLLAELARLRDRSEWTVRVEMSAPGDAEPGPDDPAGGTAYLLRRREERHHQAQLHAALASVDEALAGLADAVAGPGIHGPGPSMARSYLVADAVRGNFAAVAAEAAAELELRGGALTLTGPLPAYSFVRVRLEAPSHA